MISGSQVDCAVTPSVSSPELFNSDTGTDTDLNCKSVSSQAALRELCWKMGEQFPGSFSQEGIAFVPVYPHLGFLHWHICEKTVCKIRERVGNLFDRARLVIRVYDVTGVQFDGFNAVSQFDVGIQGLTGCYYLKLDHFECSLMAEVGFVLQNSQFEACSRSSPMYFDRPRKSSCFRTSGLYVNQAFTRIFTVENVACASVFDDMSRHLEDAGDITLRVAVINNEKAVSSAPLEERPVTRFINSVLDKCKTMGAAPKSFFPADRAQIDYDSLSLINRVQELSHALVKSFIRQHKRSPFCCIQCHDWFSAPAAMEASDLSRLPLVAVLHSLEIQRVGGAERGEESGWIEQWERKLIQRAQSVLASSETVRELVIKHYGKESDAVFLVPDTLAAAPDGGRNADYIRCRYGLSDKEPVILFAGEIAWHNGTDLLVDVIPEVIREFSQGQYVFAGEGPQKAELQHRAWCKGVGDRCRFLGDVPGELFGQLLSACDFVVIPARKPQNNALLQVALKAGKPVLATHQACLSEVRHGVNGLLVYDNPGSIIWGLKQMLSNPLRVLRSSVSDGSSLLRTTESIAALYITRWAHVASVAKEKVNG